MTMTRRAALTAGASVAAAPFITSAAASAAPNGPWRHPVTGTHLLTTVTASTNWRVTAIVLRYADRIDWRGVTVAPSAFEVQATIGGRTASRTVTGVRPGAEPGELVVDLDPRDADAIAATVDPLPLDRAYTIRQTADLTTRTGTLVPAPPWAWQNDDVINPVVDDFGAGTFVDSTGFELNFRLFRPAGAGRDRGTRYPLVVTLHGGGEVADNNMTQLTGNRIAVTFAKPERQRRHPAFVLAPQIPLPRPMDGPDGTDWTDARVRTSTVELIDAFTAHEPVDLDRIYLVGLSSGGRGIYDLLPRYPTKFAAAVPTSGWGVASAVATITDIPLWADHSIDDPIVPYREGRFGRPGTWTLMNALEAAGTKVTRGEWANNLPKPEFEARSKALLRQASAAGNHVLFTSYTAGTTAVNPHLAWAQTYENDVLIEWLFAQSRREARTGNRTP